MGKSIWAEGGELSICFYRRKNVFDGFLKIKFFFKVFFVKNKM